MDTNSSIKSEAFLIEPSSNWTIIKSTLRIEKSLGVDTFLDTLVDQFTKFVNDQWQLKCSVNRPDPNVNELIISMRQSR